MQKIMVNNGAFALYRIKMGQLSSKFSAWYTSSGELKDCERIDTRGRSYRPGKKQMTYLAYLGKIWV